MIGNRILKDVVVGYWEDWLSFQGNFAAFVEYMEDRRIENQMKSAYQEISKKIEEKK